MAKDILCVELILIILQFSCFYAIEFEDYEYGEGGYGWLAFNAYKICKERQELQTKELKGVCDTLQEAIEQTFDYAGEELRPLFNAGDANGEITKRALTPRWRRKFERILNDTFEWMPTRPKSARNVKKLKERIYNKFFKWFTEVLKNPPERELPQQVKDWFPGIEDLV